ncbi:MAG: hypothetical protein M1837_004335 [Sclerophora amabilis]|nr:MAG: hypothetical protein M1837_004335 [Sclerophora amabilis]
MASLASQRPIPSQPSLPPSNSVSALDSFIKSAEASLSSPETAKTPSQPPSHPSHLIYLATQTLHNLQYQHDWTSLAIHTHHQSLSPSTPSSKSSSQSPLSPVLLPRPLISGIPPRRLYIHPDEQVELLLAKEKKKKQRQQLQQQQNLGSRDESATATAGAGDQSSRVQQVDEDETEDEDERSERREWVLPTHIHEKWSLRKFAEVFDAIDSQPTAPPHAPSPAAQDTVDEGRDLQTSSVNGASPTRGDESRKRAPRPREGEEEEHNLSADSSGRGLKRVLLATVNDDSTIVYYIVHDGLVKPRQN